MRPPELVKALVLVPMSPRGTSTQVLVPSTLMFSRFWSMALGSGCGGRSVMTAYLPENWSPATAVACTFHFAWPASRAKVRPYDGLRMVTCTDRAGSQSTQLGEGVLIETRYGVPGNAQPTMSKSGSQPLPEGVDVAPSRSTSTSMA